MNAVAGSSSTSKMLAWLGAPSNPSSGLNEVVLPTNGLPRFPTGTRTEAPPGSCDDAVSRTANAQARAETCSGSSAIHLGTTLLQRPTRWLTVAGSFGRVVEDRCVSGEFRLRRRCLQLRPGYGLTTQPLRHMV